MVQLPNLSAPVDRASRDLVQPIRLWTRLSYPPFGYGSLHPLAVDELKYTNKTLPVDLSLYSPRRMLAEEKGHLQGHFGQHCQTLMCTSLEGAPAGF